MNSICPMNFFRTTDTTDTTIWKPGLKDRLMDATTYSFRSCIRGYHDLCRRMSGIQSLVNFWINNIKYREENIGDKNPLVLRIWRNSINE